MNTRFWVKLAMGLTAVALLVVLGWHMAVWLADVLTDFLGGGAIDNTSGDYAVSTPEPYPTMPAYMGDDSFYDTAGSVDFE